MGKIRYLFALATAIACPLMVGSGSVVGQAINDVALMSAEIYQNDSTSIMTESQTEQHAPTPPVITESPLVSTTVTTTAPVTEPVITVPEKPLEGQPMGQVITQNLTPFTEDIDLTAEGNHSGDIWREHYGNSAATDHITMTGGAQVRNRTALSNDDVLSSAEILPEIRLKEYSAEPQVLIAHTHSTECFEPYSRDYYDSEYSTRTQNPERNIIAVGDALAQELAAHGITVLHDCTIHDHPAYSGAYDRSEETIRAALEEHPEIKIVIDLHRDAIENPDGSRIAPVAEIDGRSAAQFMIIAGCDDGRFNMPDYMENFRLACLIQRSAERLYPDLARPVLFDYRNYNQHITTGSLLIEVGGHANSLDEALYTGKLLGEAMAQAFEQITE